MISTKMKLLTLLFVTASLHASMITMDFSGVWDTPCRWSNFHNVCGPQIGLLNTGNSFSGDFLYDSDFASGTLNTANWSLGGDLYAPKSSYYAPQGVFHYAQITFMTHASINPFCSENWGWGTEYAILVTADSISGHCREVGEVEWTNVAASGVYVGAENYTVSVTTTPEPRWGFIVLAIVLTWRLRKIRIPRYVSKIIPSPWLP